MHVCEYSCSVYLCLSCVWRCECQRTALGRQSFFFHPVEASTPSVLCRLLLASWSAEFLGFLLSAYRCPIGALGHRYVYGI